MITSELQKRIHAGDREAFHSVYAKYGRDVYLRARKILDDEQAARSAVKQTFLNLHRELLQAEDDLDLPSRIRDLLESELLLRRVLVSGGGENAAAIVAAQDAEAPQKPKPVDSEPVFAEREEQSETLAGLPPLERTRAYMRADGADAPAGKQHAQKTVPPRRGRGFGLFLLIVFLLFLLWTLTGVLMGLDLIPRFNLGYEWFNAAVFPFFQFGA